MWDGLVVAPEASPPGRLLYVGAGVRYEFCQCSGFATKSGGCPSVWEFLYVMAGGKSGRFKIFYRVQTRQFFFFA
jgi:hypothetical protein